MKLISLNVERNKHVERSLPFLRKESPDVICLQEATEIYAQELLKMGYNVEFKENIIFPDKPKPTIEGLLMASKKPLSNLEIFYYHRTKEPLPTFNNTFYSETHPHFCIFADVEEFKIGTAHFPIAEDKGLVSKYQEKAILPFRKIVEEKPPHIMCGDFNVARNINPIYDVLTKLYTDNIPSQYKSSIDKDLHRLSNNPTKDYIFNEMMVDYIFSQPPYKVSNVELKFGVSDHATVIAEVELE